MAEIDEPQRFELCDEPMDAIGRQVEADQLDRDKTVGVRIVRAKHRAQRSCPDLMENSKWSEGVRRRRADSFRVQCVLL
jgi:hypothetical protein